MCLHVRIGVYDMTRGTERAVKSLKSSRDLEITKPEKGNKTAVIFTNHYLGLAYKHVNDKDTHSIWLPNLSYT